MAELGPGLYEVLITEGLRAQLNDLAKRLPVDERPLDGGDAADRIAWHVSRQVERALLDVSDDQRVEVGVRIARALTRSAWRAHRAGPRRTPGWAGCGPAGGGASQP